MGRDEVCAALGSLVLLGIGIEVESLGSDMGTVCVRGRVFSGCCVAPQASCACPRPLPTLISLPPNSSLYRPVVSFRIRHPPAAAALGSLPCSGSMFPPHASHSFIIGFSFSFPASPAPVHASRHLPQSSSAHFHRPPSTLVAAKDSPLAMSSGFPCRSTLDPMAAMRQPFSLTGRVTNPYFAPLPPICQQQRPLRPRRP